MRNLQRAVAVAVGLALASAVPAIAARGQTPPPPNGTPVPPAASATPSAGFVIGPDDVLSIMVWREKELSGDFQVRPDGKISLLLVNEVQAAGLTPEQLRENLSKAYNQFVSNATVYVAVKQINSRKVFITGQVARPGEYPLGTQMTVLRLIAVAGGLLEFADKEDIILLRRERRPDGQPWMYRINYDQITRRMRGSQDLELQPGDTVIVK